MHVVIKSELNPRSLSLKLYQAHKVTHLPLSCRLLRVCLSWLLAYAQSAVHRQLEAKAHVAISSASEHATLSFSQLVHISVVVGIVVPE